MEIGDRVLSINMSNSKGVNGTIVGRKYMEGERRYYFAIKFDTPISYGHSCDGLVEDGFGYWLPESFLKLAEESSETKEEKTRIRWYSKGRFKDWEDKS